MDLDEIGLYAIGYAYRGQSEQQLPLGWSGHFEDRTGVACRPMGAQNGRSAFLLHCPWRNGTGITFQQFKFELPAQASRIRLRGATAMRSDIVGQSDGVTFRVRVNGQTRLQVHRTNDLWQDFEFDLTALRGTAALLRFEVDPGPQNNPGWDYSLWGERELVFDGFAPAPVVHAPPMPLVLSNLWSRPSGDVAPPSAFAGNGSVQLSNNVATLCYAGPDGTLEYRWQAPQSIQDPLFGSLTLHARMTGAEPVSVPLANAAALTWVRTATSRSNSWVLTSEGIALVRRFDVGGTAATVRVAGRLAGKSLVLTVTADQPEVSRFDPGRWGPTVHRQSMAVPYYSGPVEYLPRENLFVNRYLDWTVSDASAHGDGVADYLPRTDGTRSRLEERVVFTAAWHLAEVFPNLPNPPSPHLEALADRVVLDIWGGAFTNVAQNLLRLADYGLDRWVALVHVWQRSGYDNALPAHLPANADLGGDAGMAGLVATGNRLGVPVALHENYVDYYPNYDAFDPNDIALDSSGQRVLAWLNESTGIQSFAVKPNAILRLATAQSPEIHNRYQTRACYLDVHSAVPPWFHVDYRAGESGAGAFARVWDVHRQLWGFERATHSGPVFGEGNEHWYWSGWLDGVEAQFGSSGWPAMAGLSAPLNVAFDLVKIHPLQLNHGMGYYERWWPKDAVTNWAGSAPPPMIVLDQYRLQEVAYGHAGFLGGSIYASIPLAALEHHLMSPVTARYGTARPTDLAHWVDGRWRDPTAAAKADPDRLHDRVRVVYDNGLIVTANGADTTLDEGEWRLPQFGWIAAGAGVCAGTVLREGVVTDWADTGEALFVNARPAVDWDLSGFRRVRPTVGTFEQTAPRTFRVGYRWAVESRLAANYRCFVHFTTNGVIRWQQDHSVVPATSVWQPGQTVQDGPFTIGVPAGMPDGNYDWLIGLFNVVSGERVRLLGVDDGSQRIRLGQLRIQNGGAQIAFAPETGMGTDPSLVYHQHLNVAGTPVDFGEIRTDGALWLRREGTAWAMQTWPRDRAFVVDLLTDAFPMPATVSSSGGAASQVAPVPLAGEGRWRLPLNGGREYRWTSAQGRSPRIEVVERDGGWVARWPAWASDWSLDASSNIVAAADWSPVTPGATIQGGACEFRFPGDGPTRFYRLRRPD